MEGRREYLQMIQDHIGRMSTISAIFKGFAATIVAGISLICYSTTHMWVVVLSFLPVLSFAALDIYYLRLEKKFRYLFNQVRLGNHRVDYSMELVKDKKEIKEAKATVWDCIKSPSIYLFYPLMIVILGIVAILKMSGVI